jgi:hypothetical protein
MGFRKFLFWLLLSCLQVVHSPIAQAVSQSPDPSQTQGARSVPCSTSEFPYFFRVFVRGLDDIMPRSAVRAAHVWTQVEIRNYQKPSELITTVPKQDYDSFRIGLMHNLWIYLDPAVPSYSDNYPRLQVKFKTINRQKVRVEYQQAEYASVKKGRTTEERLVKTFGKPGAYIFEHRNACWRLTQELR